MALFKSRRKATARPDGRLAGITTAGVRLLARKDYDAISMAEIARDAGCSVGALYARFPDKKALLYHVIATTFRASSAVINFGAGDNGPKSLTVASQVQNIVTITASAMTAPRVAGVIRAAVKLGMKYPGAIKPFEAYRGAFSDRAVKALSQFPNIPPNEVRLGMQVVLATITDAVLQPEPGPMRAGSDRMKSALTDILLGYLGLARSGSRVGRRASGSSKGSAPKREGDQAGTPGIPAIDPAEHSSRNPGTQKAKLADPLRPPAKTPASSKTPRKPAKRNSSSTPAGLKRRRH